MAGCKKDLKKFGKGPDEPGTPLSLKYGPCRASCTWTEWQKATGVLCDKKKVTKRLDKIRNECIGNGLGVSNIA